MPLNYSLFANLAGLPQRSDDGTGNNTSESEWGSTLQPFVRIAPASYPDATGQDPDVINEAILTDPAAITETVMNGDDREDPNRFGVNEALQFIGQFITHDITGSVGGGSGTIGMVDENGLPIGFHLARNAGTSDDPNVVRDQINAENSVLDLGHVYDNTTATKDVLWNPATGKMIESSGGFLPTGPDLVAVHGTDAVTNAGVNPNSNAVAGDGRFFQTNQLVSWHTMFMKNHNYHVDQLEDTIGENWSGEDLYDAARALNEAEFQWIVYNEYLPFVIGRKNVADYDDYDSQVNPDIINEFTTVAFRFGHDQASNTFDLLDENGNITQQGLSLQNSFNGFGGVAFTDLETQAEWIRGQLARVTQEVDGFVANGNRGGLFGIPGLNLEAFDILRGHDHGVSDYNTLREGLNSALGLKGNAFLEVYDTWDAFFAESIIGNDVTRQDQLKAIYGSNPEDVANMDAVIGILLEAKVDGNLDKDSLLGETATMLLKLQFANIRDGDSHYFENRFDDAQIAAIKEVSLAEIIERNSEVDHVYHEAMIAARRSGTDGDSATYEAPNDQREDLIIGDDRANSLSGRGGSDDIYGKEGNDRLNGQQGEDWIWGGGGNDTIEGQNNGDRLWGDTGNDTMNGGNGNDRMDGGGGLDTMTGGNGDDTLHGGEGAGNDRLDGGADNDTMTGGGGNDRFTYSGGRDIITDYELANGANQSDVLILKVAGIDTVLQTESQWEGFLSTFAGESFDDADLVLNFGGSNVLVLQDVVDEFAFV